MKYYVALMEEKDCKKYNCSGYALGTYVPMDCQQTLDTCLNDFTTEPALPLSVRYYLWTWDTKSIDNTTGEVLEELPNFHHIIRYDPLSDNYAKCASAPLHKYEDPYEEKPLVVHKHPTYTTFRSNLKEYVFYVRA